MRLPFCLPSECRTSYLLTYADDHLQLQVNPMGDGDSGLRPLFVDFLHGRMGYRHSHDTTVRQPLARAVGVKPGFRPDIFDATAGLGSDGFVLACLGCHVVLNERSPVIGALLEDGLQRAAEDPRTREIVDSRIRFQVADGRKALLDCDPAPYTVYLDPMYPHAKKSALNRREMRLIREVVGHDEDGPELLEVALARAVNRVVVKRPKGAPCLGGRQPTHEIVMKNSRFDVYLIPRREL